MATKIVTAADLKRAKWTPKSFASGPDYHVQSWICAEFPRVVFRQTTARGKMTETMLVDGKDVGESAAAADILNVANIREQS